MSWFAALLVPGLALAALPEDDIAPILALSQAPPGVVFEIVSSDENALDWAIPRVRGAAERLRARFPGLPLAVVTHGREQFALSRADQDRRKPLHDTIRRMTAEEAIEVQVCGTHAGWRGLDREDFPDYVRVAPSATTALADYAELGYLKLVVRPTPNRR